MLICKAPVRISFGGGGTDLESYYKKHGGMVLSTTINKYCYTTLSERNDTKIEITSSDYKMNEIFDHHDDISIGGILQIPKAVMKQYKVSGVSIHVESQIPSGSGLGLSGAVTACLVKLASLFKNLSLSKHEVAEKASEIEIGVLKRPIGLQDQFASSFGGLNVFEFSDKGVKVTPLKLSRRVLQSLQDNLMLFYTGYSRNSAQILSEQNKRCKAGAKNVLRYLADIKQLGYRMVDALKAEDIDAFGALLHESWIIKRQIVSTISSPHIDACYDIARQNGALGGKITGAGGGGFMLLYCPKKSQAAVKSAFALEGLKEMSFAFENEGVSVEYDPQYAKRLITPEDYLKNLNVVVRKLDHQKIRKIIDVIFDAYKKDKQIFILGNGGSAATASHFCCDLAKTIQVEGKRGFKVIPMTDNVPLMTAWGNDTSYDNIFAGQMKNLLAPEDIVIGISGGGNSPSVLEAVKLARSRGAVTVGLMGFKGGKLVKLVDEGLVVPSDNYQLIEDVHMILVHLIVTVLMEEVKGS